MNSKLVAQGNITRQRILNFLVSYNLQYNRAPAIREIMKATRIRSTSSTAYHLRKLEQAGSIELVPGITRGIIITDKTIRQQYLVVYMCHYPGGCDFRSNSPGDCQIHGVPLVPNVWRVAK